MTDNEKLARWQGWESDEKGKLFFVIPLRGVLYTLPDHLNDDAAAMSLLDTLIEKGYELRIQHRGSNVYDWECYVCNQFGSISNVLFKPTINEAIVSAVLELIEKEADSANS